MYLNFILAQRLKPVDEFKGQRRFEAQIFDEIFACKHHLVENEETEIAPRQMIFQFLF